MVEIEDGISLSTRVIGDLQDKIILMASGSIFNYKQFDITFIPFLKKQLPNYSIINYDYVGIGDSSFSDNDVDFLNLADQQIQLIEAMNLSDFHLFGYSKGCMINHIVAAKLPDKIISIAGYGSPNIADDQSINKTRSEFALRLQNTKSLSGIYDQKIDNKNFSLVYDTVYVPTIFNEKQVYQLSFKERIINRYVKGKLKPLLIGTKIQSIDKLYRFYGREILQDDKQRYIDAIKEIQIPSLLMHGGHDRTIPKSSSIKLNEWFPNSQLEIFDNFKHADVLIRKRQAKALVNRYKAFINTI